MYIILPGKPTVQARTQNVIAAKVANFILAWFRSLVWMVIIYRKSFCWPADSVSKRCLMKSYKENLVFILNL